MTSQDAIYSELPATSADLNSHFNRLQQFLLQLKNDMLEAQRSQFEETSKRMEAAYSETRPWHHRRLSSCQVEKPVYLSTASSAEGSKRKSSEITPRDSNGKEGIGSSHLAQPPPGSSKKNIKFPEAKSGREQSSDDMRKFSQTRMQKSTLVTARVNHSSDELPTTILANRLVPSQFFGRFQHNTFQLVKNPLFDVVCGLIICTNAVLIGIETEYLARDGDAPKAVDHMQLGLNGWYLAELMLRILGFGRTFWLGEDRNWNFFDTFLVFSALLDLFMTNIQIQNFTAARVLRAVRLFRIVRTLRIIRSLKYVREFRKMVFSLVASVQTLFWSLLLVFGVMYSFALWFTQSAAYRKKDYEDGADIPLAAVNELHEFYSSFARTIYSLFAAISGGYSWHVLLDPWLETKSDLTVIMFFVYISVVVFGLLNIVTSVFVESAMHATQHFQDLLVDAKKKDLEMYTYHMKRIFNEMDKDGGGSISFKEMNVFLNDLESELPQYLEALGISSSDVWVLFRLLDKDGSGMIDIDEFCNGCMRLKGEARSFDINCMIYESRAMIKYQSEFMEFVEDRFRNLEMLHERTREDIYKYSQASYKHLHCAPNGHSTFRDTSRGSSGASPHGAGNGISTPNRLQLRC